MENNDWENKSDPIKDLNRVINIIRNQGYRKISFMQALQYDNNMLYLIGYTSGQIKHYNDLAINSILKK